MNLANNRFKREDARYYRSNDGHWLILDGRNRVYLSTDGGAVFHSEIFSSGSFTGGPGSPGPMQIKFTMTRRPALTTYRWQEELWAEGDKLVVGGIEIGVPYRRHMIDYYRERGEKRVAMAAQGRRFLVDLDAVIGLGLSLKEVRENKCGTIYAVGKLVRGGRLFNRCSEPKEGFLVYNYAACAGSLGSMTWTTEEI